MPQKNLHFLVGWEPELFFKIMHASSACRLWYVNQLRNHLIWCRVNLRTVSEKISRALLRAAVEFNCHFMDFKINIIALLWELWKARGVGGGFLRQVQCSYHIGFILLPLESSVFSFIVLGRQFQSPRGRLIKAHRNVSLHKYSFKLTFF